MGRIRYGCSSLGSLLIARCCKRFSNRLKATFNYENHGTTCETWCNMTPTLARESRNEENATIMMMVNDWFPQLL